MDLNKVLERVRKLVAMAEADIAPGATESERAHTIREQEQARAQADALMLKYAIDEIAAEAARPVGDRAKPGIIKVAVGGTGYLLGYISGMAEDIAKHCRCRIRHYAEWNRQEHQYYAKVYGFESDLRYFEMLFTTLRLHMLGVLMPKIESSRSLDENCYYLHNAGYNWLQIAELYGWEKMRPYQYPDIKIPYRHKDSEEVQPSTQVGSHFKRAYFRAIKARNEKPTTIPASGSETFRRSAADGYTTRIWQRLHKAAEGRNTGAALVLRSRMDDLEALFREDNPELFKEHEPAPDCEACKASKSGYCRRHPKPRKYTPPPFSAAGYDAGVAHANTASLDPETTSHVTRALS